MGDATLRPATSASGRPTRASARPSPSGSAGSTRRPISRTGPPASRGSATRSSTRATRRPSWPGWVAAASPRTSSIGRSARSRATSTLRILDSTDPAYVSATLDDLDPLRTLVIIASKSGTTTEPNAFLAYAWDRAERALKAVPHHTYEHPGAYFAIITDPGKSLEAIAHHDDVREVFLNPPDIGGRYSALTYVGLVPASLIGIDLDALLASALAMARRLPRARSGANPGLSLGLAIGTLAKAGRDKLTFLPDDEIASFGAWLEQLIAESTGKHGVGIVPVDLEPLGPVEAYGTDRAFVRIALAGGTDGGRDALADALEAAGHPVIRIDIADPIDLGAEFVRWEVATAIAGRGPRHRPVRPAQRRGGQGADPRGARGRRGRARPDEAGRPDRGRRRPDPVRRRGAPAHRGRWRRHRGAGPPPRPPPRRTPTSCLQAFIAPTPARDEAIARIRTLLRDADRPRDDRRLRPALPPLDRPAAQGRRADRLVPPADLGPPGRRRHPGLAVHLRPAHRRPGGRRLRRDRGARPADRPGPPRRRPRRRAGRPRAGARTGLRLTPAALDAATEA